MIIQLEINTYKEVGNFFHLDTVFLMVKALSNFSFNYQLHEIITICKSVTFFWEFIIMLHPDSEFSPHAILQIFMQKRIAGSQPHFPAIPRMSIFSSS